MELRDFLRTVRRNWAVMVVVLAVFLIVGSAYTLTQKPSYSASATAYISVSSSGSSVGDLSQGADYVQQAVKSYAGVATSAYVLSNVITDLGLSQSVGQLRSQVTVSPPVDTTLLQISATAAAPQDAARIANSVTSELSAAVDRLTTESRASTTAVLLTQIDPAMAPAAPTSPNVPLNLGIAALLGLLAGIGLAVLRDRLDTRIRDADDAHAVVDAPVLGEILHDPAAGTRPLVAAAGDDSRRAEAYRTLRTNLEFLDLNRRARSMVVTSSMAREGKSLTVANLAVILAEAGRSVVVVDADLRRPQVTSYFGLDDHVGLTDVLIGAVTLEDALQRWRGSTGPVVLPAGRIPPNPSELLQSDVMRELILHLEKLFDVVLFDAPPIVPVSDAVILTRRTGGALLIAAEGQTRRANLRRAAGALRQVDGTVLGLVMTMVPPRQAPGYGYERVARPAQEPEPVSPTPAVAGGAAQPRSGRQ